MQPYRTPTLVPPKYKWSVRAKDGVETQVYPLLCLVGRCRGSGSRHIFSGLDLFDCLKEFYTIQKTEVPEP